MVKIKRTETVCSNCGGFRRVNGTNFFKSYSPIHLNGYVSICKFCVYKIYEDLLKDNDVRKTLIEICKLLDKPFVDEVFNIAIDTCKDSKKFLGNYFRLVHMQQWLKQDVKRFDDSIYENKSQENYRLASQKVGNSEQSQNIINNEKKYICSNGTDGFILTDEIIDKWGEGYTTEHYKRFEKKYNKLIKSYSEKTELHAEGLIVYIRYRVCEEMATAAGNLKEAKEFGQLATKAAIDAKINVSQLSKSDISGGVDVLSQLFEAVENECGIIPHLPKLIEQPYDDVDLIIWCVINYMRRLEDKPRIEYKEIWNFYDKAIEDFYKQKGFNTKQIKEEKVKRNNVFRDLGQVYKEPLYEERE